MKKLLVMDFDDTLAKVNARILLKNKHGERYLTPAQFAVYTPKVGDSFNFSEFNAEIKKATDIKKNLNILKKAAADYSTKVTILTARHIGYTIKRYLKKKHNLDIYVVALGSPDPKKKAEYIEKQIMSGYNQITFIDDSPKNIAAVEELKNKYPKVSFSIIHHINESLMKSKANINGVEFELGRVYSNPFATAFKKL